MKYKVTLNGKTYEVEVEVGKVVLLELQRLLQQPQPLRLHQQHRQHRQLLQYRPYLFCLMANQ